MNNSLVILASFSTWASVTCLILYIASVIESVKIEKSDEETARALPLFFRLFMPLTPNFTSLAKRESFDNTRKTLQEKIIMAGFENVIDAEHFIALRFVMGIFGALCFLLVTVAGKPIPGVIIFAAFYFWPTVWLHKTVEKRHREIQRALPNVLDLLTLSVEAGKDFLTSLRDILARRRRDALGEELERTFHEIQLGKKRVQALKDLVTRVKQPDLSSVMNAIIQSDELGVSIAQLLRIQGDQLRMKRFQRAEKLANEAPVKIIFPIALFIAPAVGIIMMAPLFGQIMKTLFK